MIRTMIRTLLSATPTTLLLATAAAAQTTDVCFPEEYSVDRHSYLTAEMDVLVDKEWFSLPQQQVRSDFTLSPTQAVSSYEDYVAEIRYIAILDVDPGTGDTTVTSCSTTPIAGPLERNCLAFDTIRREDQVLGGVLPAENFVLPSPNDPNLIQFDYLVARLGSETVPTRLVARTVQPSQSLIEFVNHGFEVDPSVFELPPECVNARASTESAAAHLRGLLGAGRVEALSQLPRFRWLIEEPPTDP